LSVFAFMTLSHLGSSLPAWPLLHSFACSSTFPRSHRCSSSPHAFLYACFAHLWFSNIFMPETHLGKVLKRIFGLSIWIQ
jgi:hypothetical protein